MKNVTLRSIAMVALLCVIAVGLASASPVSTSNLIGISSPGPKTVTTTFISFPAAGDAYCGSNTCGTLTSGGETDYMWTAGNFVQSAAFSLSNGPIIGLSANWTYENFIGNGAAELWYVFINNTPVAFFVASDDNYNGDIFTVSGSVSFAPYTVPLSSSYNVSLVLQNSIGLGNGSIGWFDGGVTGITTVPEPGSLMLLGSGVVGLAGLLRRKLF